MILALVSKKGGVGKTTTAVSLAAGLARLGQRTLLIDLDSQASASLSVGMGRSQLFPSAADVLLGEVPMIDAVHHTEVGGLDLVPASTDLLHADMELSGRGRKEHLLAHHLQPLRSSYDTILIDCPPSLSLLPLNALVASDGYIVPAAPQFLALEGVANLLSACDRLVQRTGTRTRLIGILLTMVDYRLRATRLNVDAIRQRFSDSVFSVEVRVNVRLAEAPETGKPIYDYDPTATGARAYELMTEELLLRCRRLLPPEVAPAAELQAAPPADPTLDPTLDEVDTDTASQPDDTESRPDDAFRPRWRAFDDRS